MQGSAADIIKRAMIKVDSWLDESALDARIIMQVHDELVLEVNKNNTQAVVAGLEEHMCAAAALSIPLEVEIGVGSNWDAAH
jgi:DNA polymerase-1